MKNDDKEKKTTKKKKPQKKNVKNLHGYRNAVSSLLEHNKLLKHTPQSHTRLLITLTSHRLSDQVVIFKVQLNPIFIFSHIQNIILLNLLATTDKYFRISIYLIISPMSFLQAQFPNYTFALCGMFCVSSAPLIDRHLLTARS